MFRQDSTRRACLVNGNDNETGWVFPGELSSLIQVLLTVGVRIWLFFLFFCHEAKLLTTCASRQFTGTPVASRQWMPNQCGYTHE